MRVSTPAPPEMVSAPRPPVIWLGPSPPVMSKPSVCPDRVTSRLLPLAITTRSMPLMLASTAANTVEPVILKTSPLPAPPEMVSSASFAVPVMKKVSSPSPPARLSAPAPPVIASAPPPPLMVSLSIEPVMVSGPAPPVTPTAAMVTAVALKVRVSSAATSALEEFAAPPMAWSLPRS